MALESLWWHFCITSTFYILSLDQWLLASLRVVAVTKQEENKFCSLANLFLWLLLMLVVTPDQGYKDPDCSSVLYVNWNRMVTFTERSHNYTSGVKSRGISHSFLILIALFQKHWLWKTPHSLSAAAILCHDSITTAIFLLVLALLCWYFNFTF